MTSLNVLLAVLVAFVLETTSITTFVTSLNGRLLMPRAVLVVDVCDVWEYTIRLSLSLVTVVFMDTPCDGILLVIRRVKSYEVPIDFMIVLPTVGSRSMTRFSSCAGDGGDFLQPKLKSASEKIKRIKTEYPAIDKILKNKKRREKSKLKMKA